MVYKFIFQFKLKFYTCFSKTWLAYTLSQSLNASPPTISKTRMTYVSWTPHIWPVCFWCKACAQRQMIGTLITRREELSILNIILSGQCELHIWQQPLLVTKQYLIVLKQEPIFSNLQASVREISSAACAEK